MAKARRRCKRSARRNKRKLRHYLNRTLKRRQKGGVLRETLPDCAPGATTATGEQHKGRYNMLVTYPNFMAIATSTGWQSSQNLFPVVVPPAAERVRDELAALKAMHAAKELSGQEYAEIEADLLRTQDGLDTELKAAKKTSAAAVAAAKEKSEVGQEAADTVQATMEACKLGETLKSMQVLGGLVHPDNHISVFSLGGITVEWRSFIWSLCDEIPYGRVTFRGNVLTYFEFLKLTAWAFERKINKQPGLCPDKAPNPAAAVFVSEASESILLNSREYDLSQALSSDQWERDKSPSLSLKIIAGETSAVFEEEGKKYIADVTEFKSDSLGRYVAYRAFAMARLRGRCLMSPEKCTDLQSEITSKITNEELRRGEVEMPSLEDTKKLLEQQKTNSQWVADFGNFALAVFADLVPGVNTAIAVKDNLKSTMEYTYTSLKETVKGMVQVGKHLPVPDRVSTAGEALAERVSDALTGATEAAKDNLVKRLGTKRPVLASAIETLYQSVFSDPEEVDTESLGRALIDYLLKDDMISVQFAVPDIRLDMDADAADSLQAVAEMVGSLLDRTNRVDNPGEEQGKPIVGEPLGMMYRSTVCLPKISDKLMVNARDVEILSAKQVKAIKEHADALAKRSTAGLEANLRNIVEGTDTALPAEGETWGLAESAPIKFGSPSSPARDVTVMPVEGDLALQQQQAAALRALDPEALIGKRISVHGRVGKVMMTVSGYGRATKHKVRWEDDNKEENLQLQKEGKKGGEPFTLLDGVEVGSDVAEKLRKSQACAEDPRLCSD